MSEIHAHLSEKIGFMEKQLSFSQRKQKEASAELKSVESKLSAERLEIIRIDRENKECETNIIETEILLKKEKEQFVALDAKLEASIAKIQAKFQNVANIFETRKEDMDREVKALAGQLNQALNAAKNIEDIRIKTLETRREMERMKAKLKAYKCFKMYKTLHSVNAAHSRDNDKHGKMISFLQKKQNETSRNLYSLEEEVKKLRKEMEKLEKWNGKNSNRNIQLGRMQNVENNSKLLNISSHRISQGIQNNNPPNSSPTQEKTQEKTQERKCFEKPENVDKTQSTKMPINNDNEQHDKYTEKDRSALLNYAKFLEDEISRLS